MKWTKVKHTDLPDTKVLGICLEEGYGYQEMLIGYIHSEICGPAIETEYEVLSNVTHYIPVEDLLKLEIS